MNFQHQSEDFPFRTNLPENLNNDNRLPISQTLENIEFIQRFDCLYNHNFIDVLFLNQINFEQNNYSNNGRPPILAKPKKM